MILVLWSRHRALVEGPGEMLFCSRGADGRVGVGGMVLGIVTGPDESKKPGVVVRITRTIWKVVSEW
jgi:hypothetical protein